LTLEAALALATAQNPTLSAARIELDSTEGGITQARVIPNPEIAVQMEDTAPPHAPPLARSTFRSNWAASAARGSALQTARATWPRHSLAPRRPTCGPA
jgi:hypothetical protein